MTGETASSGPMPASVTWLPSVSVFCRLRVSGMHYWGAAPNSVVFLQQPHRHEFHIECTVPVDHDDRDVEFILMKGLVWNYLRRTYAYDPTDELLSFRQASCEMIARDLARWLLQYYGAAEWAEVEVSEDGENGATVLEVRG